MMEIREGDITETIRLIKARVRTFADAPSFLGYAIHITNGVAELELNYIDRKNGSSVRESYTYALPVHKRT